MPSDTPRLETARMPSVGTRRGRRPADRSAPPAAVGRRPSDIELAAARLLLEPWHWLTAPKISGLEHVPRHRPILVVANHTLMGVLDVPLLVFAVHDQRGIFLRSLGDHLHFRIPLWRDLLTHFGTVDGTRENCRALMRAGESILVFPGGGREVFKHKGEQYRLIWKERAGFVRLAVEHGYAILPLAAVGAEECYDIVVDSDELLATPLGPLLRRIAPRADEIPPLVRGIGPLPRPERFYFHFGRAIDTRPYAGRQRDAVLCMALRERVRRAVERGMRRLLAERARDPQRALRARLIRELRGVLATPETASGAARATSSSPTTLRRSGGAAHGRRG
jgi:1-acyl-sn-glycerol-3-phosphate acyltransferase